MAENKRDELTEIIEVGLFNLEDNLRNVWDQFEELKIAFEKRKELTERK